MAPIATPITRTTSHSVAVAAPPDAVYRLVADVSGWPQIFGPTVHVDVLREAPETGGEQLLRIWATAAGQVRNWTSRRVLDPAARTVGFRQVVCAAPVAAMGGEWRIEADGEGSRVELLHDYRAVDDDPQAEELIAQAIDRNSNAELGALKATAELGAARAQLHFTFHDSVTVSGADPGDVFAFLDQAGRWPERLPHVARLDLIEDTTDSQAVVQHMDMDTRGGDGSTHNTVSTRISFPDRREIVYKQSRVPAAMTGHTGRWTIVPDVDGTFEVTSWHTVTLDPQGVRTLLGPDVTLDEARALVRRTLGANSSATLRHAAEFAGRQAAGATEGAHGTR
ncbi:aromatase/cyclase [Streptomyces sp. NPDC051561]|uniref:aromatase/cyclase n=1 Tax=Streptomyces sp. NPDC051561 TaxID=3365658 RepID=UPI0037ACD5BA